MEPLSANDPRAVGEFALRARLGSGGMGRVYLGFSPGGRAVAIKVVHPELARDPEFLQRFGREVASARAVSGVYTAPVVASGLGDDPPWMATAFVPGPPLSDVVNKHGPLPEDAVWRLAAGLTEALHAVHACNLVHRDLKPSNVLLAPDGPHVIDFGISRAFEGTALTSAGMVVGTPGYMSPEQAEGQQADPPSDVFSLGCVLAYAATGAAPFGAGSAASVLYKVVTAEPDLRPVPNPLRQVIEACLSKRASERIGLSQLSAMIVTLGPATPLALGSFWPEPVASIVAADQGYPTPTQVSQPPASPAQSAWPPTAAGGQAGPASMVSPAAMNSAGSMPSPGPMPSPAQDAPLPGIPVTGAQFGQWAAGQPVPTPTSLGDPGQPAAIQPGTIQPGTPPRGPMQGGTGHAPMVADGYYAAATSMMPGGQAQPQYPQPPAQPQYPQPSAGQSWQPQYPGGQQPPWSQPAAQYAAPSWQQPAGQTSAPQQQPATPWPQPAQSTPWPQQQGTPTPWPTAGGPGAPGIPNPLAQYTHGRRRPARTEIPSVVLTATRLMYLGAVATVLYAMFGALAEARDNNYAPLHPLRPVAAQQAHAMAGDLALTAVFGGIIGIMCWIVVATSARRGHGWTRIAATILLALHTVGMLTVLLVTHGDPAVKVTTVIVWAIGLTAVILLWSQQAGRFFLAWRKR